MHIINFLSFLRKYKFSITHKLLLWSFVLILIFVGTTFYLFTQINKIISSSNQIVNVHYNITKISDELIEDIFTLIEYKKKYLILEDSEYKAKYNKEFAAFQDIFLSFMDRPTVKETYKTLPKEKNSDLQVISTAKQSKFLKDEQMNSWIETISAIRQQHHIKMVTALDNLQSDSSAAARTGFIGLALSFVVGVIGSLILAFFINRSTKELKRGIQDIYKEGSYRPIQVFSKDELGELATVFNEMSLRLKKEDERRSDFISMLSHEIRTPLTSIREGLSMLMEGTMGSLNEAQQRLLNVASQETNRLTSLLQRLMYASHLEINSIEVSSKKQEALPLIENTIQRLQPLAEKKDIAFNMDIGNKYFVLADREHVEQVLVNLLGNAIKFSPESSDVFITVQAEKGKKSILFCIQDQGPGISEKEIPYVFDKYYRGNSVKESIDGAGLGLHVSRKIVQAYGGRMWVEKGPEKGSVFCFSLPRG